MKRSLTIFVFAFVAFSNLFGQAIETPTCYAYLPGRESTLKFKYSYEGESFYSNFRFIKGSQNAFEVGDKIIMEASNGMAITFCVSENMLKQDNNEYIPFEISAEEMNILQNSIMSISIVRHGERFVLEQNEYYRTLTQKNARLIADNAYRVEKLNRQEKAIKEKIDTKRKITKESEEAGLPPAYYNNIYIGNESFQDNIVCGYIGGVRLGKESKLYAQFGAQMLWNINQPKGENIFLTFPLDLSYRFYLGNSGVALSPFIGGTFNINTAGSSNDHTLMLPGFEFGYNIDYKKAYIGTVYHAEFFTKKYLGHIRGLAFRIGVHF